MNKWDKVLEKTSKTSKSNENALLEKVSESAASHMMERYVTYLKEKIEFLPWVSVIFTSATEKKRLDKILDAAIHIA